MYSTFYSHQNLQRELTCSIKKKIYVLPGIERHGQRLKFATIAQITLILEQRTTKRCSFNKFFKLTGFNSALFSGE